MAFECDRVSWAIEKGIESLVDFVCILDRILEEKPMNKQIYFTLIAGWMDVNALGSNLEMKMVVNSWESGMREVVSVPQARLRQGARLRQFGR